MKVLKEISGHDRDLTLPVDEVLYDVLTANQGNLILMVFAVTLIFRCDFVARWTRETLDPEASIQPFPGILPEVLGLIARKNSRKDQT